MLATLKEENESKFVWARERERDSKRERALKQPWIKFAENFLFKLVLEKQTLNTNGGNVKILNRNETLKTESSQHRQCLRSKIRAISNVKRLQEQLLLKYPKTFDQNEHLQTLYVTSVYCHMLFMKIRCILIKIQTSILISIQIQFILTHWEWPI